MDPLTAGVELAQTVITRIWPDKSAAEAAQLAAQVAIIQGQLDTNRAEASSPSGFTSGWRPAGIVLDHPLPALPGIDDNLWQLMLGMLGLGGLRTFEKTKGVAS